MLRLNGHKFYSTGTLYADANSSYTPDVAIEMGRRLEAAGNDLQVISPTDRDGVELFDDWDGFGQRTTASGSSASPTSPSMPTR